MSKTPTPEAQRRRLESDLVVIGTGVIAFGAWTIAKTALLCALHGADMQYALFSMGAEVPLSIIFAAFGIAVGIDFAMRLFVGLSARSEGMGKRTRRVYLAVAVLMALICAASVAIVLIVYGISKLVYFFTMARHMVGGLAMLFVGIIAIDLGAFAITLLDEPRIAVILYLIGRNGFAGLVGIVRAVERRRVGSSWKSTLFHAIVNLSLVVACLAFINSSEIIIAIFCIGLLYSAVTRIAAAFRRTDIIFIQ